MSDNYMIYEVHNTSLSRILLNMFTSGADIHRESFIAANGIDEIMTLSNYGIIQKKFGQNWYHLTSFGERCSFAVRSSDVLLIKIPIEE